MACLPKPEGLLSGSGAGTFVRKSKPCWCLLVRDDKMIPQPAQMAIAKRADATTAEVPGSHAIDVSNPQAVAALIKQAVSTLGSKADIQSNVRWR
jgi:hypothetical protein